MTKKKRKHHDVWQRYLKAWTRGGKIFCLRDGKIFAPSLDGVANWRDFYKPEPLTPEEVAFIQALTIQRTQRPIQREVNQGWIAFLTLPNRLHAVLDQAGLNATQGTEIIDAALHNFEEDFHAKIESEAVGLLESLLAHDASFFTNDDTRLDFIYFVCVQYTRTARMQQAIVAALGDKVSGVRVANVWRILRHIYASNTGWVIYAQNDAWRLIFLDNPTDTPFITGDQPIINTYASPGQEPVDLEFYYPLSPKLALLVTKSAAAANGTSMALALDQVHCYNRHITQSSYQQIYAQSREILQRIQAGLYR